MFSFDADSVADLEAEGWRAYYDRRWGPLLRLLVTLSQDQFHIPFPLSAVAAYYVTRAAFAWAPVRHDAREVQTWYTRFYRLARRYSGLEFEPRKAAALELEYNDVHRRLVGVEDKSAFVDTMTRLHAEIFGLSPAKARYSAERRVLAATIVDRITGGLSSDPESDWAQIHTALRECYRSIQSQLPASEPPTPHITPYRFTSVWLVAAPIQSVWDAIYDSEHWPQWWPYVAAVDELAQGDADGVGAVRRYTWTTRLPYRFVFESRVTRVTRPYVLEASASGQLNGVGRWNLSANAQGTRVQYDWNVSTGVAWMNALAPVARPIFAWNHDAVMHSGGKGLGRLLGVPVRIPG
jgi:uncharacterized protein YndB with AHSA1/START domain